MPDAGQWPRRCPGLSASQPHHTCGAKRQPVGIPANRFSAPPVWQTFPEAADPSGSSRLAFTEADHPSGCRRLTLA